MCSLNLKYALILCTFRLLCCSEVQGQENQSAADLEQILLRMNQMEEVIEKMKGKIFGLENENAKLKQTSKEMNVEIQKLKQKFYVQTETGKEEKNEWVNKPNDKEETGVFKNKISTRRTKGR